MLYIRHQKEKITFRKTYLDESKENIFKKHFSGDRDENAFNGEKQKNSSRNLIMATKY